MRAHRFVLLLLAGLFALPAAARDDQAPGWFRYRLGDFTVTALQDGSVELPTSGLNGLPRETVESLAAGAFDGNAKAAQTSFNSFLVDTGTHRILVDAGNDECYGWKTGGLPRNLTAAGYPPETIDIIVLTHMHGDHICGLMIGGKRVFPNATVWAAAEEAAYWLNPANKAMPQQARAAVAFYGKDFRTFKPGETIAPGLTIVPVPGHTPGHTAYEFQSGGAKLLAWGDVVHFHAVQFAHPEVWILSDTDHDKAVANRRALFAKLADGDTVIAGAHLPFPGIGRLRKDGNGYRFAPVEFAPKP